MRIVRSLLILFVLLLAAIFSFLLIPKGDRIACISHQPMLPGEAGYEWIDLSKREVWATTDFTAEEYAAFSFPLHWPLWRKNDPRTLLADEGEFLQSPGCSMPGQFTYLEAFDKTFLKVVQLIDLQGATDGHRLIRRIELEKYHVLTYRAGRSVSLLHSPEGERFIAVASTSPPRSAPPSLPEGWMLASHLLKADLQVSLLGRVSVLRMDNEDSYQGPLSEDLRF